MSNVIKFKLDSDEIDRAIKELKDYRKELAKKVELFVEKLANVGIQVASLRISNTRGDSEMPVVNKEKYPYGGGTTTKAVISINGKDVLFVEFGAGVIFNPVDHPLAAKLGYGPGTYPGQTHVPVPGYWYYGHGKLSVGTEASMPIFGAAEAMREKVVEVAHEVFGG